MTPEHSASDSAVPESAVPARGLGFRAEMRALPVTTRWIVYFALASAVTLVLQCATLMPTILARYGWVDPGSR